MYPKDIFTYSYLSGPVLMKYDLDRPILSGNCRLAIQLYFYRVHNIFLAQDEIYLPGGYKTLGEFVFKEESIRWNEVMVGDIVYAQNIRKKSGEPYQRDRNNYSSYEDWVYDLHSAIYVGENKIWHATSVAGGPDLWAMEKFEDYYKPISVKRLLP